MISNENLARWRARLAEKDVEIALVRAALDAMTVVRDKRPYYRTANDMPMEMPRKVERVVRRALERKDGVDDGKPTTR
jgi:hypothetical protein